MVNRDTRFTFTSGVIVTIVVNRDSPHLSVTIKLIVEGAVSYLCAEVLFAVSYSLQYSLARLLGLLLLCHIARGWGSSSVDSHAMSYGPIPPPHQTTAGGKW